MRFVNWMMALFFLVVLAITEPNWKNNHWSE